MNPRIRVGATLAEVLKVHGHAPRGQPRKARVAALLEMVGLPPSFGERFPHQLSGGQRLGDRVAGYWWELSMRQIFTMPYLGGLAALLVALLGFGTLLMLAPRRPHREPEQPAAQPAGPTTAA